MTDLNFLHTMVGEMWRQIHLGSLGQWKNEFLILHIIEFNLSVEEAWDEIR